MSDLGRSVHAGLTRAQLPVAAYFDESFYQREMDVLFKGGPGYIGHELMVPKLGDYHTLIAEQNGRALIHNQHGVECISNICRHRQAIMLQGRGNAEQIVCPLHRWTYDLVGDLKGAPHFAQQPQLCLPKTPLQNWHGLLLEGTRDLTKDLGDLACAPDFNFDGYMFDHAEVHECPYNWKTFVEVYLEDYHVEPFHPGLGRFVNCDTLSWQFGEWYSVQTVGVHRALGNPGTPIYERWHKQVLKNGGGHAPARGAIWFTYFPNLMVEWYPHVLVVSTLHPKGPRHTTNVVEFYYPEEQMLFERDFVAAQQAAYRETGAEDDEIAIRMDAGRQRLFERGDSDAGPYQTPMEDGMQHFHEFIRNKLDGALFV